MKNKKVLKISLCILVGMIILCIAGFIGKNKFLHTTYAKLNDTDQKMLKEYNQLYEQIRKEALWKDFDLKDKSILAMSKDSLDTYLINPKKVPGNLFAQKIEMPKDFGMQSVYRIAPIVPQTLTIRLNIGSNFSTIGNKYFVLGNDVYYVKYDKETSFKKPNTSNHFAPFLAHESFHYYMQNEWKLPRNPENELSKTDLDLLKEEYQILDNINAELELHKNHDKLNDYAKQYVEVVSERIESNKEYVTSELSQETAEGTAQYLTIKTSKLVGYDYGIMYFDNVTNVPLSDIFKQIEAGNFNVNYLYSQMPYQTGALLCFLFDELEIPNWQEKLNSQTLDKPVYLYDILKEYVVKED